VQELERVLSSRLTIVGIEHTAKPFAAMKLLLEYTVLFDEILDHRLLLAAKPAGQGNYDD